MIPCPACKGKGTKGEDSCATCSGFGNIDKKETPHWKVLDVKDVNFIWLLLG
jgi:DnaJ-class molecular chaperone